MDHSIVSEMSPRASDYPLIADVSYIDAIPSMNALEILRETVSILRTYPSTFMTILFLLICPVSIAFLSNFLIDQAIVTWLGLRLMLLSITSGLPSTHFVRQICHHLAGTVVSYAFCFPFLITLLLLARACIAYLVACNYAGRKFIAADFVKMARRIWRSLVRTYICVCASIAVCIAIFFILMVSVCKSLNALGYPPEIIVYPALLTVLGFSVAYAHAIIVCNLAVVISVLEDASGLNAILRSVKLVKGQMQTGLLIFLGSAIYLAFIEGLFEHRVKTLSYGDGSSRIWEGPLLVLMHSFALLIDSMMSSVFYFTCKSSCIESLRESAINEEEMENLSFDSVTE